MTEEYFENYKPTFVHFNGVNYGDPNTYVDTMSMTKNFIAYVYSCLFLTKIIKPSDKVCKYFPEWNTPTYKIITFDNLLTHGRSLVDVNYPQAVYAQNQKDVIKYVTSLPIYSNPKGYSNTGYILLGHLLRVITRKSISANIKKYLPGIHFKYLLINKRELGHAHILMRGRDAIKLPELFDIRVINYMVKKHYSIKKIKNMYVLLEGWGYQQLIFNRRTVFVHLNKITGAYRKNSEPFNDAADKLVELVLSGKA